MDDALSGDGLSRPGTAATIQDADDPDGDRRLGECVRAVRQRAGLTIQELAQRTQISVGMISLLERGRATPSVRTLRLLSVALDVPISYFFEARPEPEGPRYIVRRAARRLLRLTPSGVLKEALAPEGKGLLEMYELTLSPGGSSGAEFLQHEGEKGGYVLAGRLRLWLDHQPHILEPGDTFRFPSQVPHMFDNPSNEPVRVIWVTSSTSGQGPTGPVRPATGALVPRR